jgi:hypothetical protein
VKIDAKKMKNEKIIAKNNSKQKSCLPPGGQRGNIIKRNFQLWQFLKEVQMPI